MRSQKAPSGVRIDPDASAVVTANGRGPLCECRVETYPAVSGEVVVLRVAGEVDLATQDSLERALAGCWDRGPRCLVVDLSAVTFCGVCGLTLIADAAARAAAGPAVFAVSGLSPVLDRVADILWEPGHPTRYRSLAAAVTAVRAGQARHDEAPRD